MLSWSRNGGCSNSRPAHRQRSEKLRYGLGALALLSCVGAALRAQDLPSGMIARFDFTQQLEYSDNPDLDVDGDADFFGRTILGFGLESVTNIQRFALNLGTDIEEFQDENDDDFNFNNTFGALSYDRTTRNAFIGADLNYRETDNDGDISDDDFDQDSDVLTQDDGTRVSYGYNLRGGFGQEAPVGASFNWSYNEINFRDTGDDDLNDSTTDAFSGQVDFRVTPRVTVSLIGSYRDFDTENPTGTDREETGLGVSTEMLVNPIWTVNAGLSYDQIDRSDAEERSDEGVTPTIRATRAMPNGSLGFSYSSNVFANDDGRRSFLSVSRDMVLPRGALSFSLGATGADAVGTDPLIEADYRHDLPTGQLTFGLSQRVVVDDDDNENLNTSLRASYDQRVNSVSSYGIDFSFFDRNGLDGDIDDSQRYEVGLSYRYDLTRDWGLVSGISHTFLQEEDEEDRQRTTVFVGVQRTFNWVP